MYELTLEYLPVLVNAYSECCVNAVVGDVLLDGEVADTAVLEWIPAIPTVVVVVAAAAVTTSKDLGVSAASSF